MVLLRAYPCLSLSIGRRTLQCQSTMVIPSKHGSYREPKVLNVLEFDDLIRVTLNVLEFVLDVLEHS